MIETRMHNNGEEHKHNGYDYWHPVIRVHAESTRDELPAGHVLPKKDLYRKLILDRIEVSPIQQMNLGKSLEIGAVQSLMEGLQHHRYAISTPIIQGKIAVIGEAYNQEYALFYSEWKPNHSDKLHRYLIEVRRGEDIYVGYFPYDGRVPRLYGIYHKKQDVIKFLHKTHNASLQIPELTLLTELNIPNVRFETETAGNFSSESDLKKYGVSHIGIFHKQGYFYTHSFYGEFIPFQECKFTPDGVTETSGKWNEEVDATGFNLGNPKHPYYMFQSATGYVQLYEGKMFCYPDGSIRFLTKEQEDSIVRTYIDLQIVQGDLVSYEGVNIPSIVKWCEGNKNGSVRQSGVKSISLDRHQIESDKAFSLLIHDEEAERIHSLAWESKIATAGDTIFVDDDCILTITHPEHGETKHEAMKGEMLALLPGTSRPFQKDIGGVD